MVCFTMAVQQVGKPFPFRSCNVIYLYNIDPLFIASMVLSLNYGWPLKSGHFTSFALASCRLIPSLALDSPLQDDD